MWFRKNTKSYIQDHYWFEFLLWIRTALEEEKTTYQWIHTEGGEVVHWTMARNDHNFWLWYELHKGIQNNIQKSS